ncbi:HalOD1 output domain-containing protein [Halobaculum litoreum]|uniref:HalOD1 output domain-containing protein n=1 Tax=Halobaculum litoreum TaxID=3031998 RepID=A0ABD5XRZ9_9EURY
MTVDKTTNDRPVAGGTYRADWTEFEQPSTGVVVAVAEATDREPEALPVLNDYVDGDALDTLLTESPGDAEVSFTYGEATVRVSADGPIVVDLFD